MKQSTPNYMKFILSKVCGLEILESSDMRSMF